MVRVMEALPSSPSASISARLGHRLIWSRRSTELVAVAVSVYSTAACVAFAGAVKLSVVCHQPGVGAAADEDAVRPRSVLVALYQRTPRVQVQPPALTLESTSSRKPLPPEPVGSGNLAERMTLVVAVEEVMVPA